MAPIKGLCLLIKMSSTLSCTKKLLSISKEKKLPSNPFFCLLLQMKTENDLDILPSANSFAQLRTRLQDSLQLH